jgi:hypothetical protein
VYGRRAMQFIINLNKIMMQPSCAIAKNFRHEIHALRQDSENFAATRTAVRFSTGGGTVARGVRLASRLVFWVIRLKHTF